MMGVTEFLVFPAVALYKANLKWKKKKSYRWEG